MIQNRIPQFSPDGYFIRTRAEIFAAADAFAAMVADLAAHFADRGITKVVGAEARGFIVGAAVALRLGAGFVPCRKPGELPRTELRESYALAYGSDVLEIHADARTSDDGVLSVDDLAASGGTTTAMVRLARASGARLVGFGLVVELAFLDPRAVIAAETDAEVFSLVAVD